MTIAASLSLPGSLLRLSSRRRESPAQGLRLLSLRHRQSTLEFTEPRRCRPRACRRRGSLAPTEWASQHRQASLRHPHLSRQWQPKVLLVLRQAGTPTTRTRSSPAMRQQVRWIIRFTSRYTGRRRPKQPTNINRSKRARGSLRRMQAGSRGA